MKLVAISFACALLQVLLIGSWAIALHILSNNSVETWSSLKAAGFELYDWLPGLERAIPEIGLLKKPFYLIFLFTYLANLVSLLLSPFIYLFIFRLSRLRRTDWSYSGALLDVDKRMLLIRRVLLVVVPLFFVAISYMGFGTRSARILNDISFPALFYMSFLAHCCCMMAALSVAFSRDSPGATPRPRLSSRP